jgi:hypothetical protein
VGPVHSAIMNWRTPGGVPTYADPKLEPSALLMPLDLRSDLVSDLHTSVDESDDDCAMKDMTDERMVGSITAQERAVLLDPPALTGTVALMYMSLKRVGCHGGHHFANTLQASVLVIQLAVCGVFALYLVNLTEQDRHDMYKTLARNRCINWGVVVSCMISVLFLLLVCMNSSSINPGFVYLTAVYLVCELACNLRQVQLGWFCKCAGDVGLAVNTVKCAFACVLCKFLRKGNGGDSVAVPVCTALIVVATALRYLPCAIKYHLCFVLVTPVCAFIIAFSLCRKEAGAPCEV